MKGVWNGINYEKWVGEKFYEKIDLIKIWNAIRKRKVVFLVRKE